MPQGPPGFLAIVDLIRPGRPGTWEVRNVSLQGVASRFAADPEPEFVDINARGVAAVTLQENNHVALVRLADGRLVDHFSAGSVTHGADLTEDGLIDFSDTLVDARREPDAIRWARGQLVTANEGDYDLDTAFVGGRGWTVFARDGHVRFDSGARLERRIAESVGTTTIAPATEASSLRDWRSLTSAAKCSRSWEPSAPTRSSSTD